MASPGAPACLHRHATPLRARPARTCSGDHRDAPGEHVGNCSWFPVAPHLFLPDLSCPSKRAMLRVVLGGLLVATAQVRSCLGGEWARRCVRASGAPATFPAAWARRPGREVAEHPRSARELTRVSTRRRFRCRLCPRSAAPRVSGLQFRACLPPPAPRRSALCVPLRV
jgi:hypothetical protein